MHLEDLEPSLKFWIASFVKSAPLKKRTKALTWLGMLRVNIKIY